MRFSPARSTLLHCSCGPYDNKCVLSITYRVPTVQMHMTLGFQETPQPGSSQPQGTLQ